MKTTIELPDAPFREAKRYSARHGIPLREIVERGVRAVVSDTAPAGRRFRLKTVTTKGEGVAGDVDWATLRSFIYQGHGG